MRTFNSEKENQFNHQQEDDFNCRDLFKHLHIQCSQGYPGKSYCIECEGDAVMCRDQFCPCHQLHQHCEYSQNMSKFHQKINSKLFKDYNPCKVIQKTRNLVDGILKIQHQIKEELTYFGLNSAEVEISKIIKKRSQGKPIKGCDLKKYKESRQNKKLSHFQDSLIKYKNLLQVSKINIMVLFNKLEQQIVEQHINHYEKKVMSEILASQIVNTPQQLKTLNGFINSSLRFEQTQKIFSHYGGNIMDMAKLRTACSSKQSLLFLIENNFGKKFGVYSEGGLDKKESHIFVSDDLKPTCFFSINCNKSKTSDTKRVKSRFAFAPQGLPSQLCLIFELFDKQANLSLSFLKLSSQSCYYYINGYNQYSLNGVGENPFDWRRAYRSIKSVQVFQLSFEKQKKTVTSDDQTRQKVHNSPKVQKKTINIFTRAQEIPKKKETINPFLKENQNKASNLFLKNPSVQLSGQRQTTSLKPFKQFEKDQKEDKELSQNNDGKVLSDLFKSKKEVQNNINDHGNLNVQKRPKSQIKLIQKDQDKQYRDNSKPSNSAVRSPNISNTQTNSIFQMPQKLNLFGRGNIFSIEPKNKEEEANPFNIFKQG